MFSVSNRSDGDSQSRSSSIDKDEFIRDPHTCYTILDEWRLSDEDDLRIRTPRYENELSKESSVSSKKYESIEKSSNKQDQSTTKSISRQDELPKKSKTETDECDLTDFESSKRRRLTTGIDRYEHEDELVRQRILDEFRKLRKSTDWKIKEKRMRLLEHFDYLYENYGASGQVPYPQAVFPPDEMESLLFDSISVIAESGPRNEDADTYVLFLRFAANSGYRIEPAYDAAGRSIRQRVTAVHRAALCHSYYRSAVRDLFEMYGRVDVNYVDGDGLTHFYVACRFGFEDIARDFLELGRADVGECSSSSSDAIDAQPPPPLLTWSLAQGYESTAELLLSHGADANGASCPTTIAARTRPLHALCARPNDAGFDFLERHFQNPERRGILLDAADGLGNTPLHLALASDSRKTVGWLLKHGADPNLANEAGETPLHVICKREQDDDEALLKVFLKSCSDNNRTVLMDARDNEAGDTALHSALRRGHAKLAESLLRGGADPSSLNQRGQSPLHAICTTRRNDGSLLRIFLEICDELGLLGQLKLDAADSRDRSPLQYAVARLKPRAVEALLQRGADVASFRFPGLDLFFDDSEEEDEDGDVDLKSKHVRVSGALVVAELLVNAGHQLDRRDAATMMELYARSGLFEERMVFDLCNDEDFIKKSLEIAMTDAEPKFSLRDFFVLASRPREITEKITYFECYEFIANSQKLSAMNSRQKAACLVRICEKMWRVFFHRFAVDCYWELNSYRYPLVRCERVTERLPTEDLYRLCTIAANDDKITAKIDAATTLLNKAIARREGMGIM
ncbi:hypothetical protein TKK_0013113 [Trichogramma kaykai]|uniref:Uncharacterized protein n=1 Tax=Trichogramma kaykai TaxID=54128 RepID=A0ABD2WKK2_9HYME